MIAGQVEEGLGEEVEDRVGAIDSVDTPWPVLLPAGPGSVDTSVAGFGGGPVCGAGPHREPHGLQVRARLAADAGRLLNAPEGPPEPPQCDHLPALLDAQDVGHGGERGAHRRCQRPGAGDPVAGFPAVDHWPVLGVDRGHVSLTQTLSAPYQRGNSQRREV